MTYKLGKLPAQIPSAVHDLTYYAAGALPPAPAKVAVPTVPNWGMDGNDEYGDCGVAGFDHGVKTDAAILTPTNITDRTASQVVDYYLKYTGGDDSGVVLSDFLTYVKNNNFYGTGIDCFAPVNYKDTPTLQFVIDTFGFAYVGISVTSGMQAACQMTPWVWDLHSLQSPIEGGHCIVLVGYDSQYLYGITWGGVVSIAYPAWARMADEAWAIILSSQVAAGNDGRGVNLAALRADVAKLNG